MKHGLIAAAVAAVFALLPLGMVAGTANASSTARAQEKPVKNESIDGTWQGKLALPGGQSLLLIFRVATEKGKPVAKMDVPQQGGQGIAVEKTEFDKGKGEITFDVAVIGAKFTGKRSTDGKSFEGTFAQSGQTFPLTLARATAAQVAASAPKRPQEPKPPFPYQTEEVTFENPRAKGVKLAGTLVVPPGDGPFPTVVFISGSGPQDRDETLFGHKPFAVIADYLARRRIASLRYDDRGVGTSTGDFGKATTADFADDVRAAVDYLKTRATVADPKKIGLIGHSEGGVVAPMVAVASPEDIAFLVLLAGTGVPGDQVVLTQAAAIAKASGAPDDAIAREQEFQKRVFGVIRAEKDPKKQEAKIHEILRSLTEGAPQETREQVEKALKESTAPLMSPWFQYFLSYDPAPTLAKVRCPVLVLNGEKDLQVLHGVNIPPIEAALKANPDATVKVLPGLNHLFQTADKGLVGEYGTIEETISKDVLALIGNWIAERMQ